MGFLPLMLRKY